MRRLVTTTGSALVLATLLLSSTAQAQDRRAQYRTLSLTDGRSMVAEILATEATGLRVKTPQGESLVSFELLVDMAPADVQAYDAQPLWIVYVQAPLEHQGPITESFGWVPGVEVHMAGDVVGTLSAAEAAAASRCNDDFNCLISVTAEKSWMWLVSARSTPEGGLQILSAINQGGSTIRGTQPTLAADARYQLSFEALGLTVPKEGPPKSAGDAGKQKPSRTPGSSDVSVGASFAPIPGLPAMKQGNGGGVAAAFALSGVGTAAWIGGVGQNAQNAPELIGLSVAGYYVTTVLANELTRKR